MRALLTMALCLAACGGPNRGGRSAPAAEGGGPQVGGEGTPEAPPCPADDVVLRPIEAHQAVEVGGQRASEGDRYVVIDLEITNNGFDLLPIAAPTFRVLADSGLEHFGSALTELHEDGCEGDAGLSKGRTIRCVLVFELPDDAVTERLNYTAPGGTVFSAPLTTTRCEECGSDCAIFDSDPDHCGGCDNPTPADLSCEDGEIVCGQDFDDTRRLYCDGDCVNPQWDTDHCGACGATCDGGDAQDDPDFHDADCREGVCVVILRSGRLTSCRNLCAPLECEGVDDFTWIDERDPQCELNSSHGYSCGSTPERTKEWTSRINDGPRVNCEGDFAQVSCLCLPP